MLNSIKTKSILGSHTISFGITAQLTKVGSHDVQVSSLTLLLAQEKVIKLPKDEETLTVIIHSSF